MCEILHVYFVFCIVCFLCLSVCCYTLDEPISLGTHVSVKDNNRCICRLDVWEIWRSATQMCSMKHFCNGGRTLPLVKALGLHASPAVLFIPHALLQ